MVTPTVALSIGLAVALIVLVIVFVLGLRLISALKSAEKAEAAMKEQIASLRAALEVAGRTANNWYVLSAVPWHLHNYVEALREYERIADGGGDDEDYRPDRLAGEVNDWEGQAIVRTEKALSDAVLAIIRLPENRRTASATAAALETEMIGYSGGGYRESPHRPLRESWHRLMVSLNSAE